MRVHRPHYRTYGIGEVLALHSALDGRAGTGVHGCMLVIWDGGGGRVVVDDVRVVVAHLGVDHGAAGFRVGGQSWVVRGKDGGGCADDLLS